MKTNILKLPAMMLALLLAGSISRASASGNSGAVIAGPDDAPVTIEEFADFNCKYCIRGSNIMEEVLKNYPGKVKLVFRNMPLPAHPGAMVAAKAFSAVYLQSPSLAYSFQKTLFDNQDKLLQIGEQFLYDTADKLGVNVTQMKSDMVGATVAKMIADDQQAVDSHGFQGTPSFLIGTEKIVGAQPYDEFKQIIDKQLGQ